MKTILSVLLSFATGYFGVKAFTTPNGCVDQADVIPLVGISLVLLVSFIFSNRKEYYHYDHNP